MPESSGSTSPHQNFRQLLGRIDSSRGLELQRLKVSLPWTAPLVLLFERLDKPISPASEPSPEWGRAFALWEACESKNFDHSRKILTEISTSKNGDVEAKIWRLVLLKLYRGQMNFLESTRWTIAHNFEATFTYEAPEERAKRLLPTNLDEWGEIRPLFDQIHLGDSFLPLVMSRLISLTRHDRGEAALRFLGKVLLQCSILNDGVLTADSLPDFSKSFPPKRLYGDVPQSLSASKIK